MKNKQKKLYTLTATLGWVMGVKSHLVKVQPIDGSAPVWCRNCNLNKEGYRGNEEVAFDFFVEEGFIIAKAFPLDRAEKLVEWCPHYSRKEKLTALRHPEFKGTLAEFRKFYKGLDKAKTEVPAQEEIPVETEVKAEAEAKVAAAEVEVQPAIKEEEKGSVKIPSRSYFSELCEWLKGDPVEMMKFIWRIRDDERTPGDNLIIHNLSLDDYSEEKLSSVLDNLEEEVESYVYDSGDFTKEEIAEIERKLDSDSSDVEETLPEDEVPDDAAKWDKEEAEECEEKSSEYDKYDDDSYYNFEDKPSSKGEWR